MLFHLIRKELLDQLLSLRFAVASMICLLVFLLSFTVQTREYSEAVSAYSMNQVMHRNDVLVRSDPDDLWRGITIDRPLSVMNVLVRGISSELNESVYVESGRLTFSDENHDNPVTPSFRTSTSRSSSVSS